MFRNMCCKNRYTILNLQFQSYWQCSIDIVEVADDVFFKRDLRKERKTNIYHNKRALFYTNYKAMCHFVNNRN